MKLGILYAVKKTLGIKIREIDWGFGIGQFVDLSACALSVENVIPRAALPTKRLPCKRLHWNFFGVTLAQNRTDTNCFGNTEIGLHTRKRCSRQAEIFLGSQLATTLGKCAQKQLLRIEATKVGIDIPRTVTHEMLGSLTVKVLPSRLKRNVQILCRIVIFHFLRNVNVHTANGIDHFAKRIEFNHGKVMDSHTERIPKKVFDTALTKSRECTIDLFVISICVFRISVSRNLQNRCTLFVLVDADYQNTVAKPRGTITSKQQDARDAIFLHKPYGWLCLDRFLRTYQKDSGAQNYGKHRPTKPNIVSHPYTPSNKICNDERVFQILLFCLFCCLDQKFIACADGILVDGCAFGEKILESKLIREQ